MTKIVTIGGALVFGAHGEAIQESVAGAPNIQIGAEITLLPASTEDLRSGSITTTVALPSTITAAKIVWYGLDSDGAKRHVEWPVPAALLAAMKVGAGTHAFEASVGVLGRGTLQRCSLLVRNAAGWGFVREVGGFVEGGDPVTAFSVTTAPGLDTPTENEAITGDDPEWVGDESVAWTWVYQIGPDITGPWTDIADPNGVCPEIDGANDCIRRGAAFTGPGVPPGFVSWSPGREITPTGETVDVTLVQAAIIASQRIAIDAISASGFDPGEVLTAGTATATLVEFVPDGGGATTGVLYTGPITGGPIPDNTAIWCAGGAATTDGASADYPLTPGEPVRILPAVFTGNPTRNDVIKHISTDGTDQTAEEVTWSIPPLDAANKQFRHTHRVAGLGITGTQDFSSAWTPIVEATIPALAADEWFILPPSVVNATTVQVDTICILDSIPATASRWSTGDSSFLANAPWPQGWEAMTKGATRGIVRLRYDAPVNHGQFETATAVKGAASGAYGRILHWAPLTGTTGVIFLEAITNGPFVDNETIQLGSLDGTTFTAGAASGKADGASASVTFRDWATADAIAGGKNYRQFVKTTDDARRTRWKLIWEAGTARSPASSEKTVPFLEGEDEPIDTGLQQWFRHVNRTEGAFLAGLISGDSRQFPRSYATSPARPGQVWCGVDITRPLRTKTFGDGEIWHSAPLYGMYANETTMGCLVDRWNADISLHYQSAGSLGTNAGYNDWAGIYLSMDDGETCELVLKLGDVTGSNKSPTRLLLHLLEWAPGGTSHANSTVYCLHQKRPWSGFTLGVGQLYRSDEGGKKNTWVEDGASFAATKFGQVYQIACKANDATTGKKHDLYAAHDKGLSVRLNMAAGWTDCTGLQSGKVTQIEVRGDTVWALVNGKGLYKSTGTAFTLVKSGKWSQFSVSKVTKSGKYRVWLCSATSGIKAQWSADTGATWGDITSTPSTGQLGTFEHNIGGNSSVFFIPHETDFDQCLVMRNQSMGKLVHTANSCNAVHASDGFDYSNINSICFGDSYDEYAMCATDRFFMYTDQGARFVHDSDINNDLKIEVKSILKTGDSDPTYNAYTSTGPLVLRNNGHVRALINIGPGGGAETGAGSGRVPYIGGPKTDAPVKVNGSGVGSLTDVSMPKGSKGGTYELRCTVANGNSSTWTLHAPRKMPNQLGAVLGTASGTGAKTVAGVSLSIPTGTPTTSTRFEWYHNPIGTLTVMAGHADTGYSNSDFSEANPEHPERGCAGKNRFKMSTAGVVSHDKGFSPQFRGYATGDIIYGGGDSIQRSPNEGNSWSAWWSPPSSWGSLNKSVADMCVSKHTPRRVYWANQAGEVYKVEAPDDSTAPTATKIFDFIAIMGAKSPGTVYPGKGTPNRPPVKSVTEDPFDENIIYVQMAVGGFPVSWKTTVGGGGAANWTDVSEGGVYCDARLFMNPFSGENLSTSRHGTGVLKVPDAHRATHGITVSLVDDLVLVFGDEMAVIGM